MAAPASIKAALTALVGTANDHIIIFVSFVSFEGKLTAVGVDDTITIMTPNAAKLTVNIANAVAYEEKYTPDPATTGKWFNQPKLYIS